MSAGVKDVVVIGGGVVGTSILHALSRFELELLLIEKQLDVCEGASKANSGIIATGFDAPPGSIESKCLQLSRQMWPSLIENLKIPYLPCGAIMIATHEEEKEAIFETYIPNAATNGVDVQWLSKEEVLQMNPAVTSDILGGLSIPGEAICDPFWTTRAFAELAVLNGASISLGNGVIDIVDDASKGIFTIQLEDGKTVQTRYIVNAAGLWADEIARMIGDDSFQLTPRKGQFILTEDLIAISQIIVPVPTKKSKGILVTPVVFGGILLGPTAEDQTEKWDRSITKDGLEAVRKGCEKLIPEARNARTIRQFCGVRAVSSEGDYILRASDQNPRMIHAAGIRSTGISAAPGIAQMILETLQQSALSFRLKENYQESLPELFDTHDHKDVEEVVCLCRNITKGEVMNAFHRPFVSFTIDGIKRRTGATLGDCQGNGCIPQIIDLIKEVSPSTTPMKGLQGSYLGVKEKNHEDL